MNPEARADRRLIEKEWKGAEGLAEDVRYYGKWMRDEAEKRIGHLYPKVEITAEMVRDRPDLKPYLGQKLTVIAWLWARTVKSPNPAFAHVDVPLVSTFMLCTKAGREAYVEPVVDGDSYQFRVRMGSPRDPAVTRAGTKLGRGASFRCILSGSPVSGDYVKAQGQSGHLGSRMLAIVAEGERGRVYISPVPQHEQTAREASPEWGPDVEFFQQALGFRVGNYGMSMWSDLFAPRQLVALTTLSDILVEVHQVVSIDTARPGPEEAVASSSRTQGRPAYAHAVVAYLALPEFDSRW